MKELAEARFVEPVYVAGISGNHVQRGQDKPDGVRLYDLSEQEGYPAVVFTRDGKVVGVSRGVEFTGLFVEEYTLDDFVTGEAPAPKPKSPRAGPGRPKGSVKVPKPGGKRVVAHAATPEPEE